MRILKICIASFLVLLLPQILSAQILTLNEAFELADKNYPAIQKNQLIKKSTEYSLQNASKAYLPQFSINGQATYQSEVTKIPIDMPGIKELSKDQYKIQGELSQLIYDGGTVNASKELIKANDAVQQQSIAVTMQSVKERITEMYFGVLLLEEQLKQNQLRKESLNSALKKAEAAYENGVSFKSNVNELKAEVINVNAADIEIKNNQQVYKDMLAKIIGRQIDESTKFSYPSDITTNDINNRPELKLFDLQKNIYEAQKKKLSAEWMPKLSAFVQGGYGRPGLNMLEDKFSPYAIGGIRLIFPINSLYTYKNNLKIAELYQKQLDVDKENFILNNNLQTTQQQKAIEKYQQLLNEDDKIIMLRQEVTKAAEAQLENNVITVSEYINKLNAEHLAKQNKYLHQLQLLQSKYNLYNNLGN